MCILSGFTAHCVLVYRLHGALSSSGACASPGCTAHCFHEACVVIHHAAMPSLYRVCSYTRMPVLSVRVHVLRCTTCTRTTLRVPRVHVPRCTVCTTRGTNWWYSTYCEILDERIEYSIAYGASSSIEPVWGFGPIPRCRKRLGPTRFDGPLKSPTRFPCKCDVA